MNRMGLKISCLVVSILIWVQVAATSVVEQGTTLPLRVVGLGQEYTLAGSLIPDQVDVVLRSSKLVMLAHNYFNRYIGEVRINLADRIPGPSYSYELAKSDVYSDLVVVGITPAVRLRLHVDALVSRRLPVDLVTEGSLKSELGFLVPPVIEPDSMLVTGPERFFPDEPRIRTVPIDLSKISASETFPVPLLAPHRELNMEQESGSVAMKVSDLEDRTLANIPVIPLVDAGLPEVGVSPPLADIMVRGVADSVRALTTSRFSITVPVGNREDGVYVLPGQVDHPPWLAFVRLDPPNFQVIVGNPPQIPEVGGASESSEELEVPGE
jgi:YbbR domain-containing protein